MDKMDKTHYVYQNKKGRGYETVQESDDADWINRQFLRELVAKKLAACSWVRSIRREPLFNGFHKYTVTYDHGGRSIYTIQD